VTATRSLRNGAPVTAPPPTAVRALPPAVMPPSPVAPASCSVASNAAPFTRWERAVLTATTIVGSAVLHLADKVAPEPHRL